MKRAPFKRQDATRSPATPRKASSLPKMGKKGKEWAAERARLKVRFQRIGITTCEAKLPGCWRDNGLGFMHLKKRRNLAPDELGICVLGCNACHDVLEAMPEAEMGERLQAIISARPIPV